MDMLDTAILVNIVYPLIENFNIVPTLAMLVRSDIIRGVVPVCFLWMIWLDRTGGVGVRAVRILAGASLGLATCIALQHMSAHRPRPFVDPVHGVFFQRHWPAGYRSSNVLADWSSFPSDHAVLYVGLATATFLYSRSLGAIALVWSICLVALPRALIGLHYPSDIAIGGIIGAMAMILAVRMPLPQWASTTIQTSATRWPNLAMGCAFAASHQLATQFGGLRRLADAIF